MNIRDVLELAPVIPVLTFSDVKHAVPVAEALCAGGLRVLEISLRTSLGLPAIEAIRRAVPSAIVGVGTLTRPTDFATAQRAGAHFGASPGLTPELIAAARGVRFPLLPGIMTPAELISARLAGFETVKLFPATSAGGIPMLQALSAEFPDVKFCPDGGITPATAREYLAFPSVLCVAGAWFTPPNLLGSEAWKPIERLAAEALLLR